MRDQIAANDLNAAFSKAHSELCRTLRAAAIVKFSGPAAAQIGPLFIVATELIDPASTLSWYEVPAVLRGDTAQFLPAPAAPAQHRLERRVLTHGIQNVSPPRGSTVLQNGGWEERTQSPALARNTDCVGSARTQPRTQSPAMNAAHTLAAQVCGQPRAQSPAMAGPSAVWYARSVSHAKSPHCRSTLRSQTPCRIDTFVDVREGTRRFATDNGTRLIVTARQRPSRHAVLCRP